MHQRHLLESQAKTINKTINKKIINRLMYLREADHKFIRTKHTQKRKTLFTAGVCLFIEGVF